MINQVFMRRIGGGVAGLLLLIALCPALASAATPSGEMEEIEPGS